MSVYEDYDRASADYSRLRVAVGVEILLGVYQYHWGTCPREGCLTLDVEQGSTWSRSAPTSVESRVSM